MLNIESCNIHQYITQFDHQQLISYLFEYSICFCLSFSINLVKKSQICPSSRVKNTLRRNKNINIPHKIVYLS